MSSYFTPRLWGAHLLALVLVATACGLGYWQYDAWQQRRQAQAVDLSQVDPVPLASVIGPDDPFPGDKVGQPVVLEGTWVPDGTVFVSDRVQDGRTGFWVVTPLAVGDAQAPAIPVVRGWVGAVADAPAAPSGVAAFVGLLQPTEGTGATDADPDDDVLPQLRIADVIQHVDQDLYGAYAVVDPDVAPGDWPSGASAVNDGAAGLVAADPAQLPDAGRFTAVRNLLYAVEWLVFGAFAGFVWWRFIRESADGWGAGDDPVDDPVDDPDDDLGVRPDGDPGDGRELAGSVPEDRPVSSTT